MFEKALNVLQEHGIVIKNPFEKVIFGNQTEEKGDTLVIKNIPDGLLYLLNKDQGKIKNTNSFKHVSTMIDLSRNAVMNFKFFQETIIKHALFGYDEVWLYMEDTFEVPTEPMFGYLRGKYQKEELKRMVEFASSLGITLIPCVQTLGHMAQFLRWYSSTKYQDTFDVLKVDSDATYQLIENIIKTLKEVFKTDKIHVGMDETFGLGFGRYYKEKGYKPQPELFINHLKKVNDICLKHGFNNVYIWSDMFFRMYSVNEYYYDTSISFEKTFVEQIPENVGLVYWDYYNEDKKIVTKMLENHLKLKRKVIFASGTWIWTKLTYDKTKTDKTALMHIKAAAENKIEEICFTQWQDDGSYCDYLSIDVGLFDMSNAIAKNSLDISVFKTVTGKNYQEEILYDKINQINAIPINLLWDDILFGIYKNQRFGTKPEAYNEVILGYQNYLKLLEKNKLEAVIYDFAKLILIKLQFRQNLLANYQNNKPLKELFPLLDELATQLSRVIKRFKENWLNRYKINGLEVIESRLYVFYGRIEDAKYLFEKYDKKEIKELNFLTEKSLKEPYLSPKFTDTFYTTKVF